LQPHVPRHTCPICGFQVLNITNRETGRSHNLCPYCFNNVPRDLHPDAVELRCFQCAHPTCSLAGGRNGTAGRGPGPSSAPSRGGTPAGHSGSASATPRAAVPAVAMHAFPAPGPTAHVSPSGFHAPAIVQGAGPGGVPEVVPAAATLGNSPSGFASGTGSALAGSAAMAAAAPVPNTTSAPVDSAVATSEPFLARVSRRVRSSSVPVTSPFPNTSSPALGAAAATSAEVTSGAGSTFAADVENAAPVPNTTSPAEVHGHGEVIFPCATCDGQGHLMLRRQPNGWCAQCSRHPACPRMSMLPSCVLAAQVDGVCQTCSQSFGIEVHTMRLQLTSSELVKAAIGGPGNTAVMERVCAAGCSSTLTILAQLVA